MGTVQSQDGTTIAFDTRGAGPPLILVDGGFGHRAFGPNGALAPLLAHHFTVVTYDRRGRGDSGDTPPYVVQREVDDIQALVTEVGGSAFVYGISSGGALALEAARHLPAITKLALYELPFVVDDSRRPIPPDFTARLSALIASGRRGTAVTYFMRKGVGVPALVVALMHVTPAWSKLTALAHTIPYDAAILGDTGAGKPLPARRWASVTAPTLVVDGGKSPTWTRHAMRALADTLPNATYRTLPGQTHLVKPAALAPVLVEFFAG